jgi:hypothetical protein
LEQGLDVRSLSLTKKQVKLQLNEAVALLRKKSKLNEDLGGIKTKACILF